MLCYYLYSINESSALKRARNKLKSWAKKLKPAIQWETDYKIVINWLDLTEKIRHLSPAKNFLRVTAIKLLHRAVQ